jgi:ribosomal protein S6
MKFYELAFLTPNLSIEEKEKLDKDIEQIIKNLKGEIQEKFIEKKKFAYTVKKNTEGFLGIISFSLEASSLSNFKKELKDNKNIIRAMIESKNIKPGEKMEKEKRSPAAQKPKPSLPKKPKVKIEELDKKLEEILK